MKAEEQLSYTRILAEFDGVVIATGSRARRRPGCAGMAGVHVIRTIDDAVALRAELVPGARLVVIGAGFVGANLVTELLGRGHHVRSFDRAPSPLPDHERLEVLQGDICDKATVADAPSVRAAVQAAEAALGDTGRILLRPSGTEQLVRVMVEAADEDTARRLALSVAESVSDQR